MKPVRFAIENLRRNIIWSSAKGLLLALLSYHELYGQSEVNNFDDLLIRNKYVSKLQVTVHHTLLLHLLNTVSYLTKYLADEGLRQPRLFGFELLDQLIEFLALAMLHKQV